MRCEQRVQRLWGPVGNHLLGYGAVRLPCIANLLPSYQEGRSWPVVAWWVGQEWEQTLISGSSPVRSPRACNSTLSWQLCSDSPSTGQVLAFMCLL